MNWYYSHSSWIIWFSFCVAIFLQIIPWPLQFYLFRPSWLNMLLIYWVITPPYRINIGTSFILGMIMDLILGSVLGIRSLALCILVYLVIFTFQLFRNMPVLWQQALIVTLLSLTTNVIIFWSEFLTKNISFRPEIFCSSLIDGILWPWLFSLMRKICR